MQKKLSALLMITALILLAGCAAYPPPRADQMAPPSNGPMAGPTRPAAAGSLWTTRRGSLFYDVKAREIGDLVTVAIYEKASASKEATTATGRDSDISAGITKFIGLEKDLANANRSIDPTALLGAQYKNEFKGSGSTSRKEDLIATLTTRVLEVLPNGNLRIEGGKTVRVNNEDQIIRLSGIVRPEDITPQNVVDSKYVLDANIVYTGNGVVSDKQKPGWATRILDNIWPF